MLANTILTVLPYVRVCPQFFLRRLTPLLPLHHLVPNTRPSSPSCLQRFALVPYGVLYGSSRLEWFLEQYISDLFGFGKQHTYNYLQLFQELDAHSVYHLLPDIKQPTLIVTGMLDILTPAYQSYEMYRYGDTVLLLSCSRSISPLLQPTLPLSVSNPFSSPFSLSYHTRRIPNSFMKCFMFGSHFVLVEYAEQVAQLIASFTVDFNLIQNSENHDLFSKAVALAPSSTDVSATSSPSIDSVSSPVKSTSITTEDPLKLD